MPDFDFEHLDAKNFEGMSIALCAEHIARGLRPFGSGTDGGREATFEGRMAYSAGGAPWDGYLVVQCKQKETRGTPKQEAAWAIGQLDAEMKKYQTAKKKRRIPDYFLFITNAHLSAQLETGGKDKFVERLQYWANKLNIKEVDVWDRDKLNNLVDITPKVAQRYGLLHSGNIIHYVAQNFLSHQEGIETTLSVFLQLEMRADQFISLAQTDDRPPLARVFMDLRAWYAHNPAKDVHVVAELQQVTDRPLHPTLLREEQQAQAELLRSDEEQDPEEEYEDEMSEEEAREIQEIFDSLPKDQFNIARYVLIGGPGQGKSTIGQQLAQRHRAALLKADTTKTLEFETERILQGITAAAAESGSGLPTYPRWPFRIALQDFAGALTAGQAESVLDYVALLVRKRTKRPFSAHDAEVLLSSSSTLVVFDGLDEVPAVSNRTQVVDAVRRFLFEVRDKDADVLVVATTRPQGYQNEFDEFGFLQLTLRLLSQKEALLYARKLVAEKFSMEPDQQERIMERMQAAAREPAIMRLMQSPLQVTIMVTLVDVVGILPRERYSLFERYYDIIYLREQQRGLTLSQVLVDHRTTIEILHDRIGLLLQVEAESADKTKSRISGERLRRLVYDYLVHEDYEGEELTQLTANLMDVALHRLVFIVPLEDERYGFEVRSLQEFSAARALMREDYDVVKERLRAIAPIPYWRNTSLFAIGQAFARQNTRHRDLIMQLCRELDDADDMVLVRTQAGARLALDIIEDGIVALQPRYRGQALASALRLLRLSHLATADRLMSIYTPQEADLFKKELQAVAGSEEFDKLMGLFAVLVKLTRRQEAAGSWAQALLEQHWPVPLAQQQLLLETPLSYGQGEWIDSIITRVASASSLEWVIDNMRRVGRTVPWVMEASRLRSDLAQKVKLAGKHNQFYFSIISKRVKAEWLDSLPSTQLTYYDWLPFTLGRAFMLDPSPAALADLLEALVAVDGWAPGRLYDALPWQLEPLLTGASSVEELLHLAQRARAGELGTAQDWQAAEARWLAQPITVADLTVFTDATWPYTGEIAQRGFIPAGYFGINNREEVRDNADALDLLRAFSESQSSRYRLNLAVSIFFLASYSYHVAQPLRLPLLVVQELALATPWHVFGLSVLGLLGTDIDWVGEAKVLDSIGERISMLGLEEDETAFNAMKDELLPEAIAQLAPLVGTKHLRQGILRLLATLAIAGADVPVPDLDPAQLSPEGCIALAALNLLGKAPRLAPASLMHLIESYWLHLHPRTGKSELPLVLQRVCERKGGAHTPATIEVLNALLEGSVVDAGAKLDIINCFMQQLQYRTSGLADPTRKVELATNWLFEVLSC